MNYCNKVEHQLISAALNNIGVMLHQIGDNDTAAKHFLEAAQERSAALHADKQLMKKRPCCNLSNRYIEIQQKEECIQAYLQNNPASFRNATTSLLDMYQVKESREQSMVFCKPFFIDKTTHTKSKEENDTDCAIIFYNLGLIHHENGKIEEAGNLFNAAFSLVDDKHTFLTASILNSIGQVKYRMKSYDEALRFFLKALTLENNATQNVPVEIISNTLSGIGRIHFQTGDFDQAMAVCTENLCLCTDKFGEEHMNVTVIMYNLGLIHYQRGDIELALDHCECFLEQDVGSLKCGPQVATALHTIGVMMLEDERPDHASIYLFQSLQMRKVMHEDGHEMAETLFYLGQCHYDNGKHEETIKCFEEVIALHQLFPLDCEDTRTLFFSIGETFFAMNSFDEALKAYKIALQSVYALTENKDVVAFQILLKIGNIYLEQGEVEYAGLTFSEAFVIYSSCQEPDLELLTALSILRTVGENSFHLAPAA